MYSEASIVVTFPCGPRILAEPGMVAFALCSATYFGVFHIFSAWDWMQEFTFSPIMPCRQDFFCKNYKLCWFSSAVANVLRSEAPQLMLLLPPCLLVLPDEFHVRYHHCVIFLLLHVVRRFFCVYSLRFYFTFLCWHVGIVKVVSVFYVDTINVAIPEQVCCVCPMSFYQLFSALFALKFYDWSCIFIHVIQWHFGRSWVVTFGAALTLKSRRSKFGVACATHYACLGDSLSVLRQCHCCCCCCSVFVISLFAIFYQSLFVFLHYFIFVLSVFLILIQLYSEIKYFIIIVCLFITFLQALVHWYVYESCLPSKQDSYTYEFLFAAGWRVFKHLLLLSSSESGAVHYTLHYFDFTVVGINFI